MLDGRVLGASQVEYKPFGKPPLQREVEASIPSAPGTQLMMSQSPTTKQCPVISATGSIVRSVQRF